MNFRVPLVLVLALLLTLEQASLSSATSDSTLPNYRKAKHQTGSQAKRCLKNTGDTYAKLDSDKNDSNSPIPEPDQGSGLDTPPPAESSPYPGPTPDPVPDPSTPDLACAKPIELEELQPQGVRIPPLSKNQRPNFIVILTDDQGWDDVGLHNPEYVQTPNLDKFIRSGTKFDNYYVTPQCATTRAALLTGRDYPRTGTLHVNGGWSHINPEEVTAAKFLSRAGYRTAHVGKWHNAMSLGYEAYNGVGFDDSWSAPFAPSGTTSVFTHNGVFQATNTPEYVDKLLADKVMDFLLNQTQSYQPFFMYYAPYVIHVNVDANRRAVRTYYPPAYNELFTGPKYEGIPTETIQAWASLKYLDDLMGKIFDLVGNSALRDSTYIMITGDNGSDLFPQEVPKSVRMPSMMSGEKSTVFEGGVRNCLAVVGPGIPAGVTDSTLLDVTDILPTLADLAGLSVDSSSHFPWDGISFKHLLLPETPSGSGPRGGASAAVLPANGMRGQALATEQQQERFLFHLTRLCWNADAEPELGPDREVLKPQALLDFDTGGVAAAAAGRGRGFRRCIAARYKDYKWIGESNTLYKMVNNSHIEMPCTEDPEATEISEKLQNAAREWWNSILAVPHSFNKQTFYLGLGNWRVTNVGTEGAIERTQENIRMLGLGASGFSEVGDFMCFRVQLMKAGTYNVVIYYTSVESAVMKLQVGPYEAITDSTAPSITALLPPQDALRGAAIGSIDLPATPNNTRHEACIRLVDSPGIGMPIFKNLANIAFIVAPAVPLRKQQPQDGVGLPRYTAVGTAHIPNTAGGYRTAGHNNAAAPPKAAAVNKAAGKAAPKPKVDLSALIVQRPQNRNTKKAPLSSTGPKRGPVPNSFEPSIRPNARMAAPGTAHVLSAPLTDALEVNQDHAAAKQRAPADLGAPLIPLGVMTASLQHTRSSSGSSTATQHQKHHFGFDKADFTAIQVAAPAPGLDVAGEFKWLIDGNKALLEKQGGAGLLPSNGQSKQSEGSLNDADAWTALRMHYGWPDGQGVLQSMWSPYTVEDCPECKSIPV